MPSNQIQFVVPTIASLYNLVTGSGFSAVVTDTVLGGTFSWNPMNLSLGVANNPGQGIFVPPSFDTSGASGAWVRQYSINSGGLININTLLSSPLVPDGLTSNATMLQSLAPVLGAVSPDLPVPVNVTVGNPTVISINPTVPSGGTLANPAIHYLKPNQGFYFVLSAGGSLAGLTGISLNTMYYTTSANMNSTTFTFSATNNYGPSVGEGSPVVTSGSFTGTLSIVLTGRDVDLFIPPGAYFCGNYADSVPNVYVTPNGISRIRYYGKGAKFDSKVCFGSQYSTANAATWAVDPYDYINTTPNQLVTANVNGVLTLQTPAKFINYYVGQWISVYGLDLQNPQGRVTSIPPNTQYQEYKRIVAINSVAITGITRANPGVVTTGANHGYTTGITVGIVNVAGMTAVNGTNPTITVISPTTFSIGVDTSGFSPYASGGAVSNGALTGDGPLKWVYLSTFPNITGPTTLIGGGPATIASMHPNWDMDIELHGMKWIGQTAEVQARSVLYDDCVFQGYGNAPGQAVPTTAQRYIFDKCEFGPGDFADFMQIDKNIELLEFIKCRSPNNLQIAFESPSVHICRVEGHQGSAFVGTPRQIQISSSELNSLLMGPYIGLTDAAVIKNTAFTFFDMLQRTDDPAGLSPASDMTLVANWTFSNGIFTRNITGVNQSMSWMAPGAKCFMVDAGRIYNNFQNMGSPFVIGNVYMDGSNNFSFETSLSAVPTRQTSGTVSISHASPAVVSGMSLATGTPVIFPAGSTLPAPFLVSTPYYVVSPGGATYGLSATVSGAAINSSASGSGITMVANPLCFRVHPCARFTGIGNRGCPQILDLNGAIDEPLFSRVKRGFAFKQSTLSGEPGAFETPLPRIWGALNATDKFMRVNVLKAGVGANQTFNISCPGFTQPNVGNSAFSQTIDTTTAGVRIVTSTGATSPAGVAGTEAIAPYADWVAGPLTFTWASPPAALANSPVVLFEMYTDQGITRASNIMGAPANPASGSFLWQFVDSGLVETYGALP